MKFTICSLLLATLTNPIRALSEAPTDTFKGCATPSFDWATYSTRTTARMYGMRGAISNGHIFAAGFVKSTIDTDAVDMETKDEFSLTGPFSVVDPTGTNATTVTVDLQSYAASVGAIENAGGSFGQYEVGVAKINAITGEPEDFFVYHGDGLDETSGLAASGDVLVISGHFTGSLTALLADGTSKTVWNSNVGEGGLPDDADQFHPNNKNGHGETGVDDGFVIKVSAITGAADWIVMYPESNKDSQMISVDLDVIGNVYGSGYKCDMADGAELKVCDGVVAMFASDDGALIWEKNFVDLGAVFHIKFDREDDALYVTGTTTYGGSADGKKDHPLCEHDMCSVVMRLSSVDGAVQWARTVKGSPRWGIFDQSGGLELGVEDKDGPYIYVALDDTGEGEVEDASLNAGTSYSGCMSAAGVFTAEYHIFMKKVVVAADCDFFDDTGTSTFITREAQEALPASSVTNGVRCGKQNTGDACLMKFHKHTGLPIWAVDVPPLAGIVPSSDGLSVHIAGWYYPGREAAIFDSVSLPGYLREGGLGSQTSGVFNAKLTAANGAGEYVMHSGGGSKDRLYNLVGDSDGNIYNIGYSMNLVMQWGDRLKTTMMENDVDPASTMSEAVETHMYVSKFAAATETSPSCLTTCAGNTDQAVIEGDSCFIDGKCYVAGATGAAFGKSCFVCEPSTSQREWSEGPTLGLTQCFVDNSCVNAGDAFFYQRRTWSAKIPSLCQACDPQQNAKAWSVAVGFDAIVGTNPPGDCVESFQSNSPTSPTFTPPTSIPPTPTPPTFTEDKNDVDSLIATDKEEGLDGLAVTGIVIGALLACAALVGFGVKKCSPNKKEPIVVDGVNDLCQYA